jgi:predicted transposase YbfD/YdcC
MKLKPKYSILEHFNDIKDILINVLDLAGCIVTRRFGGKLPPKSSLTIDAMGCQREIVAKIVKKEADYVIAVKKNQPSLYEQVEQLFKQAIKTRGESLKMSSFSSKEINRGREETRNYLMISDIAMSIDPLQKWQNLTSIGMVESVRVVNGKTSVETRYFISSLEGNIEKLAEAIRGHWSIENSLHWVLDVTFQEDNSRIRKDNSPANFAVLRHIAVNIIGQNKSRKLSVRRKRFLASLDEEYARELLEAIL